MWTVICSDKSIKVKHSDKDRRVDSCKDGFIFRGTIQLTEIDVSKERLQPQLKPQYHCNHSAVSLFTSSPLFSSPLSLSSSNLPLYFTSYLRPSFPPFLPSPPSPLLPFSLSLSLSIELIDYVSSIHLSLCRLATGALSGVEGGSFSEGGVGG